MLVEIEETYGNTVFYTPDSWPASAVKADGWPSDMMVRANLHATKAAKEALRLIGASNAIRMGNGMIDTQRVGQLADIGVMDSEPNIRNKISRVNLQRCQ